MFLYSSTALKQGQLFFHLSGLSSPQMLLCPIIFASGYFFFSIVSSFRNDILCSAVLLSVGFHTTLPNVLLALYMPPTYAMFIAVLL